MSCRWQRHLSFINWQGNQYQTLPSFKIHCVIIRQTEENQSTIWTNLPIYCSHTSLNTLNVTPNLYFSTLIIVFSLLPFKRMQSFITYSYGFQFAGFSLSAWLKVLQIFASSLETWDVFQRRPHAVYRVICPLFSAGQSYKVSCSIIRVSARMSRIQPEPVELLWALLSLCCSPTESVDCNTTLTHWCLHWVTAQTQTVNAMI